VILRNTNKVCPLNPLPPGVEKDGEKKACETRVRDGLCQPGKSTQRTPEQQIRRGKCRPGGKIRKSGKVFRGLEKVASGRTKKAGGPMVKIFQLARANAAGIRKFLKPGPKKGHFRPQLGDPPLRTKTGKTELERPGGHEKGGSYKKGKQTHGVVKGGVIKETTGREKWKDLEKKKL